MRIFGKKLLGGDNVIIIIMVALALISVPVIYSATGKLALSKAGGNSMYYFSRQIAYIVAGFLSMIIAYKFNLKYLYGVSKGLIFISIFLLILTFAIGEEQADSKRWLPVMFGFNIQPSEIAKFALILFFAANIYEYDSKEEGFDKAIKTVFYYSLVTIGLTLPNDLSTALLITAIMTLLFYIAGVPIKTIFKALGLLLIGVVFYSLLSYAAPDVFPGRADTWISRLINFFSGSSSGYVQSDMAKMSIYTGGLFGQGPGNGTLKYMLSQGHSDFVFSFIVEEYGMLFAFVILISYLILFFRGLNIASHTNSSFRVYIALGLSLSIVLQAFVHIGVNVGILPVTGQTLPFISMGGTSFLVVGASIGLLLSLSEAVKTEPVIKANIKAKAKG